MGMVFTLKIRKDCEICGSDLPPRHRTYCSTTCRNKAEAQRYKDYRRNWQYENRGAYMPGKKKCMICGRWYVQVGSHVIQKHEYDSAREYREDNNLPVKRGILPDWYRDMKGEIAIENGTWKNLKAGRKFWYKDGDERAKKVTGYKGRNAGASDYY